MRRSRRPRVPCLLGRRPQQCRPHDPVGALIMTRSGGVIFARGAILLCWLADAFVPQAPSMSSAPDSQYRPARLEKTGPPSPFSTFSSSGSSIDAAFRALGRIVCDEVGEEIEQQQEGRCAMGVVFFSRGERVDVPQDPLRHIPEEDAGGVESALARLHDSLPFIDDIIGEPGVYTCTIFSDHPGTLSSGVSDWGKQAWASHAVHWQGWCGAQKSTTLILPI